MATDQLDPFDRRVLLVSDQGDGTHYRPIHKEDDLAFTPGQDPLLPAGFVGSDGKWHPGRLDADGNLLTTGFGPANMEIVLAASAARTATLITVDQINTLYKGVAIWLRVTAAPASPTGFLQLSLQVRDPVEITTYLGLNARTALVPISGVGGFMWMFYPGSAGEVFTANFSGVKDVISYPLPKIWRVVVVHSDAQ